MNHCCKACAPIVHGLPAFRRWNIVFRDIINSETTFPVLPRACSENCFSKSEPNPMQIGSGNPRFPRSTNAACFHKGPAVKLVWINHTLEPLLRILYGQGLFARTIEVQPHPTNFTNIVKAGTLPAINCILPSRHKRKEVP